MNVALGGRIVIDIFVFLQLTFKTLVRSPVILGSDNEESGKTTRVMDSSRSRQTTRTSITHDGVKVVHHGIQKIRKLSRVIHSITTKVRTV